MRSIAFSTTLLIYVYSALYSWTTARFAFAGLVGFAMFSTYTLRRTAVESIAGLRAVATRVAVRKYRNAGIGLVAVLVAFAGHWELKIPAEFKVVARNELTVRTETEGIIVELLVHEGSRVTKGEVLARLLDGSELLPYRERYGPTLICGTGTIGGYPVGVLINDGVLFSESAQKAANSSTLPAVMPITVAF